MSGLNSQQQFDNIISCYRCMKDLDDFDESWDPYEIDTLEKFKEALPSAELLLVLPKDEIARWLHELW